MAARPGAPGVHLVATGPSAFLGVALATEIDTLDPVDAARFKERGASPGGVLSLTKQYVARVKAAADDSRKISFVVSTSKVDRDNDVIDAKGWELENYLKNPVVLWAHQRSMPPIGRAEKVRVVGKVLKAVAEFAPAEIYPLADTVYQMLKGGWLRAVSVGFLPIKGGYAWNDARGGYDFTKQELFEFSPCPVPSNPDALMEAKSHGVPMGPLKEWAERTLDSFGAERIDAEAARKALSTHTSITVPALPTPEPVIAITAAAPLYVVDPKDVQTAIQAVVSEVVREKVNFACGRLD